jgi:hypothetical protein
MAFGDPLHGCMGCRSLDPIAPLHVVTVQSRKGDKGMTDDRLVVRPLQDEFRPQCRV